jgi:myo-inositol-1(or 4)-monophosphatase
LGLAADLDLMRQAASEAGRIAMRYFRSDNEVWHKSGNSPVSEADIAVDTFLRESLTAARPDYGWLSEETLDNPDRLERDFIFVVDPIDGTRGFIAGEAEWCVSVGLVAGTRPVAGVLECPALERSFSAASELPAILNGEELLIEPSARIERVTASRKLNSLLARKYPGVMNVREFVPSLAYRLALVATGELDAAFARPGAQDWDLAAAEIILERAGGRLTDLHGAARLYNQERTGAPSLVASGPGRHEALLNLANSGGFLH